MKIIIIKDKGGFTIHIIGKFLEPGQVGGLIDALKNSGIQRRDMIISSYDEEKFLSMISDVNDNHVSSQVKTDQDDPGELESFVQGVNELDKENGIVVFVKCAKHKAQEVENLMDQSGAVEIKMDD